MTAFGQLLAMLAGFATPFAAGALPVSQPQAADPALGTPTRSGAKAVDVRRPGYAYNGAHRFEEEFCTEAPATRPGVPKTLRASGLDRSGRGIGKPRLAFWLNRGATRRKWVSEPTTFTHLFYYDIITNYELA